MGRDIEPYYKIGETFEFQGHTLMSVECEEHECTGCFFHDLIPNSTESHFPNGMMEKWVDEMMKLV